MRISVIIPVYNVENYLHYAMNSLFRQTYKNFEVILVNDGSTDNSGKLCEEYSQQHDNVFVYHKKNGGLSDARNFGVENAKTDWIFFLDPDDYIEAFTLELLVNLQKKYNVPLVSTKVQSTSIYNEYNDFEINNLDLTLTKKVTKETALALMLENKIATVSACAKLYHKNILQEVPFPVGKIYEDFYVVSEHLQIAEEIVICPIVTYHYYTRQNSIVNSTFTEKKYDFFDAVNHTREIIIKKFNNTNDLVKAIEVKVVLGAFPLINSVENDELNLLKIKKILKKSFNSIMFNSKVSWKHKLKYILFLFFPLKYDKIRKNFK